MSGTRIKQVQAISRCYFLTEMEQYVEDLQNFTLLVEKTGSGADVLDQKPQFFL
jgi:hypothetical protein